MLDKPLSRRRAAILVANGFLESEMTAVQRTLSAAGAAVRTISTETGLVNSWQGNSWGYNFAVDVPMNKALAAEYDVLVVPAGPRSMEKLKQTAHTKRIISGFLSAGKPVCMLGDAVALLSFFELAEGLEVAAPEKYRAELEAAGAKIAPVEIARSGSLLTGSPETAEQLQAMLAVFVDGAREAAYVASQQAA